MQDQVDISAGSDALDDDQLMARCAAGDRRSFGPLVERHQALAWAVALRFTGVPESAADLVQDAFLAVFEHASRYRPEGRFKHYLLRILVNRAVSSQRRRRFETAVAELDGIAAPSPAEEVERAEGRARVRTALQALPERQRLALILRFYEGLSYVDIADSMGTSEKSVERLLHRGRAQLRQLLG